MNPLRSGIAATVLSLAMLCGSSGFGADSPSAPTNVAASLERISADATFLTFSAAERDLPPGGHIQGIQLRHDPTNDRWLAFLSHDSRTHGYVVVVAFDAAFEHPGDVIHVHQFARGRLRHAGGIQLLGDVLVVGLEDNRTKDRSELQFWDVSNLNDWQQLKHVTISRSGPPKTKTAGAVAIVSHGDRVLVAAANWDSRDIDFYQSTHADLTNTDCQFEPAGHWSVRDADTSDWMPDAQFGSCQAINLIEQSDGHLYLMGFHQPSRDRDAADLFQLDLSADSPHLLRKVSSRQITLSDGVHFKYGGGLTIHQGDLWLLATERSLSDSVQIRLLR